MIRERFEFDTEAAAREFAAEFERQWGPGYSGSASTYHNDDTGLWVVSTTRWSSCD